MHRHVALTHCVCAEYADHCSTIVPPSGVEMTPMGGGVCPFLINWSVRYCAKYQQVAGASSNCVSFSSCGWTEHVGHEVYRGLDVGG